ncbi:MAG: hypothetical protein ABR536_04115 [Solirubrobacterales bacterium]
MMAQLPIPVWMGTERRTGNELATTRSMQLCGNCDSELVQPVNWSEASMNSWEVELRCPECEWRQQAVFSQREIDGYDRLLDDGMQCLIDDLRRLTRENMQAEAEDFATALAADLVLPEDF